MKILNPVPEVMEVFETTSFDNIITIIRGSGETATCFYSLRPIQRWMLDTHFMKAKSTMLAVRYNLKSE